MLHATERVADDLKMSRMAVVDNTTTFGGRGLSRTSLDVMDCGQLLGPLCHCTYFVI